MNDDEFNQFITLLDAACASDDPKIKKALKKFMFLVRLNISDDEMEAGPFTKMMETIDGLQRRVSELEQKNQNNFSDITDWTQTTSSPQWIYQPTYTTGGTYTMPNTTTTGITLTGGTNTTLGGSCGGFTSGTTSTSTSYIINADDSAPKGTEIKNEVKDKLKELLS